MTINEDDAARASAARRAHIEALLADYPALSEQEIALMKTWFDRQASAFDVAQIASVPAVAAQYRAFKADHIDPLGARDWVKAALFAAIVALCIAAIMWRAF